MKNKTTSTVVALTLGVCANFLTPAQAADERADKARSYYQQGMVAMNEGKYQLARTSFREVLKIYPSHPQARRQLGYINSNINSLESNKRKKELHQVVISKVDIDKATVQDAVDVLSAHVKRESKNKVSPNFIVQDTAGGFAGKTVTLNLSNVPADTLLKYITDQVGAAVRFDKHAIVIRPRQKAGGSAQ